MDLDRLEFAPQILRAATVALALLVILECLAYFAFDESPATRNMFGYSPDASFVLEVDQVAIQRTASRSFWPQRYARSKPVGLERIMIVGDSAVRGRSFDQSVSELLRRNLSQQCALQSEVWNLASPGYGSRRKAIVVQKALEFHPDLIIYHANFSTEYEDDREWMRYLEYHSWHPTHWIDHLPLLGRIKLSKAEKVYGSWLPEDVRAASLSDPLAVRIAAIQSKTNAAFWMPRMLRQLDQTVNEVRKAGVPLIILVHANLNQAGDAIGNGGLDEAIRHRYGKNDGVTVLSNTDVFAPFHDPSAMFADTAHWTVRGTELVAQALTQSVVQMNGGSTACHLGTSGLAQPSEVHPGDVRSESR